ncbi:Thiol-disulfide oxidoreductase ResA [compost metagenome]
MKKIYYLLLLIPFIGCSAPKTKFGEILEKSCLFLDTVMSLQFDRTITEVSIRSGDTQIVSGNVYLQYFNIGKKSDEYTGKLQVYNQNYTDNVIGYGKDLTKDSITFLFYQDGRMQHNTEKIHDHNFGDEQCGFLSAKSLRNMIKFREKNIDHFSIKDTSYNGVTCYHVDLFLKDSPDADINKTHESFIIRKTDYMPLCLSFSGEVAKGIVMYNRYEISNIHINEPYREAYVNISKRNSFLSNISNLIVDDTIFESPLPYNKVPLKYMNGDTATLAQFKGKVVVLDFWYRGCFYCLKLMPEINRLSAKYRDVVFLGVDSRDATRMVKEYMNKNNFRYQTVDDKKQLETKLKVTGFPTTVIIDENGSVYAVVNGFSDNAGQEIEDKIIQALKQ